MFKKHIKQTLKQVLTLTLALTMLLTSTNLNPMHVHANGAQVDNTAGNSGGGGNKLQQFNNSLAWTPNSQGYRFYVVNADLERISIVYDFYYSWPTGIGEYATSTRFDSSISPTGLDPHTINELSSWCSATDCAPAPTKLVGGERVGNGEEFKNWFFAGEDGITLGNTITTVGGGTGTGGGTGGGTKPSEDPEYACAHCKDTGIINVYLCINGCEPIDTDCVECRGTGYMVCPAELQGYCVDGVDIETGETCETCQGTGLFVYENKNVPCSDHGTQRTDCNICVDGYIVSPCPSCKKESIKCDFCDDAGYFNCWDGSYTCEDCQGTGLMACPNCSIVCSTCLISKDFCICKYKCSECGISIYPSTGLCESCTAKENEIICSVCSMRKENCTCDLKEYKCKRCGTNTYSSTEICALCKAQEKVKLPDSYFTDTSILDVTVQNIISTTRIQTSSSSVKYESVSDKEVRLAVASIGNYFNEAMSQYTTTFIRIHPDDALYYAAGMAMMPLMMASTNIMDKKPVAIIKQAIEVFKTTQAYEDAFYATNDLDLTGGNLATASIKNEYKKGYNNELLLYQPIPLAGTKETGTSNEKSPVVNFVESADGIKVDGYETAAEALMDGCYLVVEPLTWVKVRTQAGGRYDDASRYESYRTYGSYWNLVQDWVGTGGFYNSIVTVIYNNCLTTSKDVVTSTGKVIKAVTDTGAKSVAESKAMMDAGYGLAMHIYDAKVPSITSTYDEPLGDTPGPAPEAPVGFKPTHLNPEDPTSPIDETSYATIIKYYEDINLTTGEITKVDSYTREYVPKTIEIENEPNYKVKEWFTTTSTPNPSLWYDEAKSSSTLTARGSSPAIYTPPELLNPDAEPQQLTLYLLLQQEVLVETEYVYEEDLWTIYQSQLTNSANADEVNPDKTKLSDKIFLLKVPS